MSHEKSAAQTELLIEGGGIVTISLQGVHLYINAAEEISYLETEPTFSREALKVLEFVARDLSHELIGMNDGGMEDLGDGAIRHWLTQTWFPEEKEVEMTKAS